MAKYIKSNYDRNGWRELESKSVRDFDGFITDYTLYTDGDQYICVLGDKELYEPDVDYADAVFDTKSEAYEWFRSYDEDDTDWEMQADRFDNIESPYYNGDLDDDDFYTVMSSKNEYGETLYSVSIGNGTVHPYTEEVYAYNEQEAVDKVVDHLEAEESNLIVDYYDLYDIVDYGQTVDEYAEENNLVVAGNSGWYVEVVDVHEV